MMPGLLSITWTKYLKDSKLYGIGKECPKDWTLRPTPACTEKCYFEKWIAYIKYISLCPMTEDESLAFAIFLLTCFYVREHDSIEFEHIHRHIGTYYLIVVDGRRISLKAKSVKATTFSL